MTINEYQKLAQRTANTKRPSNKLENACLGLAGECGEACPLYPAKGESGECPGCINNVMRNAAWMLKVDGDSYKGGC